MVCFKNARIIAVMVDLKITAGDCMSTVSKSVTGFNTNSTEPSGCRIT